MSLFLLSTPNRPRLSVLSFPFPELFWSVQSAFSHHVEDGLRPSLVSILQLPWVLDKADSGAVVAYSHVPRVEDGLLQTLTFVPRVEDALRPVDAGLTWCYSSGHFLDCDVRLIHECGR